MSVDICAETCIGVCVDMCVDMCAVPGQFLVSKTAQRNYEDIEIMLAVRRVLRRAFRHICQYS